MPNAKISAQDRDAATKRYANYVEQIANYNVGITDYNAGATASNSANTALNDTYRSQIDAYNRDVGLYNNAEVIDGVHYREANDAEWRGSYNAFMSSPDGEAAGNGMSFEDFKSGQRWTVPMAMPVLPTAPNYGTPPDQPSATVPEEPKGWNPSLAELKNLENPVVDAGTAEVAAAKGYTANRGIVGAEAERSKQLADPNEQPLTSNKGILARVLGGEL